MQKFGGQTKSTMVYFESGLQADGIHCGWQLSMMCAYSERLLNKLFKENARKVVAKCVRQLELRQ